MELLKNRENAPKRGKAVNGTITRRREVRLNTDSGENQRVFTKSVEKQVFKKRVCTQKRVFRYIEISKGPFSTTTRQRRKVFDVTHSPW